MAKRKNNVPRPFNAGEWTKSKYMQQIRGHLRRAFMYWKPLQLAKLEARRKNQSDNKRMKWEYQCAECNEWFPDKQVQIDHVIPCGSINELYDVPIFIKKLSAESGYQVLCKDCHKRLTLEERATPITKEHWHERIEFYEEAISECKEKLNDMD